jgi:hypothetical protein
MAFTERRVRVFDLGGGGLRTAAFDVTADRGTPSLVSLVPEPRDVMTLGHAPLHVGDRQGAPGTCRVQQWMRERLPMDAEQAAGWWFGASLAELGKLWQDKCKREGGDFAQLAALPRVVCLGDGPAHLLACKAMPTVRRDSLFPLCNIAIGTGIAINFTNSKGEARGGSEMEELFGVGEEVWNFLVEREGGQDTERRAEDDDALCAIELRESGNDGRQHEQ